MSSLRHVVSKAIHVILVFLIGKPDSVLNNRYITTFSIWISTIVLNRLTPFRHKNCNMVSFNKTYLTSGCQKMWRRLHPYLDSIPSPMSRPLQPQPRCYKSCYFTYSKNWIELVNWYLAMDSTPWFGFEISPFTEHLGNQIWRKENEGTRQSSNLTKQRIVNHCSYQCCPGLSCSSFMPHLHFVTTGQ